MSYQLTGNLANAYKVILEELNNREAQQNTYHTRLLITLCMIYWLEADPSYMRMNAEKIVKLSKELSLFESADIGKHYLGLSYYCSNELDQAEQYLKGPAVSSSRVNVFNFAHSAFILSLTYLAQTRKTEAKEIVDSVVQYAIDTGNAPLLSLANAFKAELALRQGNINEAINWAINYEPEPFTTAHRFYVPQLTAAWILLAQNTQKSKTQAADLLSRLYDFYLSIHHKYCLINVLALQAVLNNSMGDESAADKKLSEALTLAEQGGYIRIFVDLGPEMAELLERQDDDSPASDYIQRLQDAFTKSESNVIAETIPATYLTGETVLKESVPFSNPLTNREQEILEMFAQRLRNQEIAEELCISDNTVKRHATNIFRKLDVQNRRKAVEQATFLGIIT
jgi:LuxR family maltose regulon positive regulatory protein